MRLNISRCHQAKAATAALVVFGGGCFAEASGAWWVTTFAAQAQRRAGPSRTAFILGLERKYPQLGIAGW
jgi:hypothetical protein